MAFNCLHKGQDIAGSLPKVESEGNMTEEKQKQVIMALITEPTKQKACEVLKINPRTLYNYMQDEDFMSAYKYAVNKLVDDSIIELKNAMKNGAGVLNDIILDEETPADTRLRAIKIAVDSVIRLSKDKSDLKTDMIEDILESMGML